MSFWIKNVSNEILLTGAKFHLNSLSGSGMIKKFHSGVKYCTVEGLNIAGTTVELKSKWKSLKCSNISCSAKISGRDLLM